MGTTADYAMNQAEHNKEDIERANKVLDEMVNLMLELLTLVRVVERRVAKLEESANAEDA